MRQKIIDLALSFLHTTYDKKGNIIFVDTYYGKPQNHKVQYCCIFVWYILTHCGLAKLFYGGKKTASCTTLLNYYKKNHPTWVHKNIDRCKPGDLVFYQFDGDSNADHIGFFISKATTSYFDAVEGNTTNKLIGGSQSNGGYVEKKRRHIKKVMAFVTLDMEEDKQCPYIEPSTTIYKGCKDVNGDVKWVQWWLNQKGYPCDIDGSFGKKSEEALKKFQKEFYPEVYHLEVDGRCGGKTRKALMS